MDQIYKGTEEDRMEPYYYSKMNKVQQAAYHAIRQGLLEISDSIQIPGMEAEELYNVFFRLRWIIRKSSGQLDISTNIIQIRLISYSSRNIYLIKTK